MSKKSWLISFVVGLLAILAVVLIVLNRNVPNPEIATVPTLALLPSVAAQQDIQADVSPTPLSQASSILVANNVVNLPATVTTIAPQAAPIEPQPAAGVQSNRVVAVPSPVPILAGVPPVIVPIPPAPVPNQIVIHFNPAASQQDRDAYIRQIGGTVGQSIDALNTVVVKVPQNIAANPLPQSPLVKKSEPDYIMVALDSPAMNDPFYSQQWALPVIKAANGWSVLPPNTPPITVAVIDSGICANQPDLFGRILPGYDYIDHDDNPQDEFGHGCGVAGIIAANPNNGIGVAGVAPNAMIMPIRVLDSQGNGSYSDVSAAIVYAVDNGAKIINLSVGGSVPETVLEDAVNYAAAHNVLLVAAAGNTGGSVLYPAAYPSVIAVASVDPDLQRSSFSSFGPEVDLLAPGLNILTTNRDGSYTNMSGTSFAAPQVSGIAALELAVGHTLTLGGGIVAFDGGVTPPTPTITPSPTPVVATQGQTINLTGWLMMLSGDPQPGSSDLPESIVYLVDKQGAKIANLSLDFGRARAFYGQQVSLTGVVTSQRQGVQADIITLNVTAIQPVTHGQSLSTDQPIEPLALTGSQPWVNILCKFQDTQNFEPSTPTQINTMFANTYPGLDDYWRKVSYNNINIVGTTTAPQWLTLPHPRSYYVNDAIPNYGANLDLLLQDCTAVANASIYFPSYVGINMMFNDWLDCCAWGGSHFVSIDGITKIYRVTWLPYWAQRSDTIAHEMGHGFGFPHSSGPADKPPNGLSVYVSDWDIMSNAGGECFIPANNGCLPQGTISYHLDLDGWIPPNRKTTVAYNTAASVNLQELSSTAPASGSLMAKIPIAGSATHFYTVEARAQTGYDQNIPGRAVIIHDVDTTRYQTPAMVVDANDGNDDVNDAGAMWTVGETFYSAANHVTISVVSSTATGFLVSIGNNLPPPIAPTLTLPTPTGVAINDTTPDFHWGAVANATQYHIQVDNNNDFSSPEAEATVSVTTFTPASSLFDALYYWRVQGISWVGTPGSWSKVGQFTLDTVKPPAPILIAPVNDPPPSTNNKPIFSWQAAATAVRYKLLLDTINPPAAIVQTSTLMTYTPATGLLPTGYYWCVKSIDAAGNVSDCGEIRKLTFLSDINAAPYRNFYTTHNPVLTWNPVTWATAYQIQIDNNVDFSSPEYDATVLSGSAWSQMIMSPLPDSVWFWRVRARHADGTWGAWSVQDIFVILAH